jgi:hypothetical protein
MTQDKSYHYITSNLLRFSFWPLKMVAQKSNNMARMFSDKIPITSRIIQLCDLRTIEHARQTSIERLVIYFLFLPPSLSNSTIVREQSKYTTSLDRITNHVLANEETDWELSPK